MWRGLFRRIFPVSHSIVVATGSTVTNILFKVISHFDKRKKDRQLGRRTDRHTDTHAARRARRNRRVLQLSAQIDEFLSFTLVKSFGDSFGSAIGKQSGSTLKRQEVRERSRCPQPANEREGEPASERWSEQASRQTRGNSCLVQFNSLVRSTAFVLIGRPQEIGSLTERETPAGI